MILLFDAHFAPPIARALREIGIEARHVREEFGPGAKDVDWIRVAGENDWVVVSGDLDLRTQPAERLALRQANVTVIFVRQAVMHRKEARLQLAWVCTHLETIQEALRNNRRGTHFEIGIRGKIKRLRPIG